MVLDRPMYKELEARILVVLSSRTLPQQLAAQSSMFVEMMSSGLDLGRYGYTRKHV
jgi:hypothetical protein